MGEFSIIKVFCINYLECMKMREKIIAVFYDNDYLKIYNNYLLSFSNLKLSSSIFSILSFGLFLNELI